MAYRLNEKGDQLHEGLKPLFKAANDLGLFVINEILKSSKNKPHEIVPLRYVENQKVWVDAKDRYVLFDIGEKESNQGVVEKYLSGLNAENDPEAVNVDGVLTTDGHLPIKLSDSSAIDIPLNTKTRRRKLDVEPFKE